MRIIQRIVIARSVKIGRHNDKGPSLVLAVVAQSLRSWQLRRHDSSAQGVRSGDTTQTSVDWPTLDIHKKNQGKGDDLLY